jgi:hypothetical protein
LIKPFRAPASAFDHFIEWAALRSLRAVMRNPAAHTH